MARQDVMNNLFTAMMSSQAETEHYPTLCMEVL